VSHSCGQHGSNLFCWGGNSSGAFGNGTTNGASNPARIGTGTDWSAIVAGGIHTCGLRTGNALFCWGGNTQGELGNSNIATEGSTVPSAALFR
jgi:alpha-tubulin suppressor-like RCC1 family protein